MRPFWWVKFILVQQIGDFGHDRPGKNRRRESLREITKDLLEYHGLLKAAQDRDDELQKCVLEASDGGSIWI